MTALRRAQDVLGTKGIRDTIDRALHEVDRVAALRRAADLVRSGKARDFNIVRVEDLPELRSARD